MVEILSPGLGGREPSFLASGWYDWLRSWGAWVWLWVVALRVLFLACGRCRETHPSCGRWAAASNCSCGTPPGGLCGIRVSEARHPGPRCTRSTAARSRELVQSTWCVATWNIASLAKRWPLLAEPLGPGAPTPQHWALQETRAGPRERVWLAAKLRRLGLHVAFGAETPANEPAGVAVVSRTPLQVLELPQMTPFATRCLAVRTQALAGPPVVVVCLYASASDSAEREALFAALPSALAPWSASRILIAGDFQASLGTSVELQLWQEWGFSWLSRQVGSTFVPASSTLDAVWGNERLASSALVSRACTLDTQHRPVFVTFWGSPPLACDPVDSASPPG